MSLHSNRISLRNEGLGMRVWRAWVSKGGRQLSNFLDFFVTFFVKEKSKDIIDSNAFFDWKNALGLGKRCLVSVFTALFLFTYCKAQTSNVTTSELLQWNFQGKGVVSKQGDQVALKEVEGSKGAMLISPSAYENDVVLNFDVLALTPATVVVAMLAVSDLGEMDELTVPDGYDGGIGLWNSDKDNYFFAFKNAPHDRTPFVKRLPADPNRAKFLAMADENHMVAGVSYNMEVGKKEGRLWLTIDGKKVLETTDDNPLSGGHIAFRVRGTAGFTAGCLIKNVRITSE